MLIRFQSLLVHPDPRRQRWAILALLLVGGLGVGLVIGLTSPIVALALAAAALGGWLVVRSPLWGLIGIVAISTLLPFATLPFKIGFTPTFLDLAIFATFGVWALKYAVREETRFEATSIGGAVLLFLILAAFAFAIGLQYSRPTANNIRQFGEMVLSITLFFVVVNVVRTPGQLVTLARALMLGGGAAALIAIIFYIIPQTATVWVLDRLARLGYPGGLGALRFVNDDPEGLLRAIGTSIDPNVLGGLMILVGAFTLPQLFAQHPLLPRRLVAALLGLDVLALYLTISRGSMLGFLIAAVTLGVLRYRKLLVWLLAAGVIFVLLPFTQDYIQNLLLGLTGQDRSTQMRFGEYRDAFALISRYPFFGVGFTGTPELGLYIGVSSVYLLITEEMGLVGLSAFLLTIVLFLNALIRGLRHHSETNPPLRPPASAIGAQPPASGPQAPAFNISAALSEPLLLGVFAAMMGLLAGGVLDHYLFNLTYPHMTALFWILIGFGMTTVTLTLTHDTTHGANS